MNIRRCLLNAWLLCVLCLPAASAFAAAHAADTTPRPNIVVILADDLGYGCLGCYGATNVQTPNIDRLAREGLRFTAAHSPCSVCTPTRYNLLTGRYCWRPVPPANRRAQWEQWHRVRAMPGDAWIGHVAIEANEPLLINEGRMTVASLLKSAGYATACVGKWHLGLGRPGSPGWDDVTGPDYNRDLAPGPLDVGFDYFFGLPIVNSSEPHVFIENRRIVGLDPADPMRLVPEYSKAGRLGFKMEGGKTARWEQDRIDERINEKALAWLDRAAKEKAPFFLYLALSCPHWPYAPGPRFKGTSERGVRGDVLHEMDARVGEVLAALERLKLARDTLLIFASDNGAEVHPSLKNARGVPDDLAVNGPLRGKKTDIYEAAHRVPLIVRWPGRVAAGSETGQWVALTDLMATFAAVAGRPLPHAAAEDSFSFLPLLLGKCDYPGQRESLVTDSMLGVLAIQEGPWKLIFGQGDCGYNPNQPEALSPKPAEPAGQLYNLADDLGETRNLYADKPEIVARLTAQLEKIKRDGRSRP